MFGVKLLVWVALGATVGVGVSYYINNDVQRQQELAMGQLDDTDEGAIAVRDDVWKRNALYAAAIGGWVFLGFLFFWGDISRLLNGDDRQDDDEDKRLLGTRRKPRR